MEGILLKSGRLRSSLGRCCKNKNKQLSSLRCKSGIKMALLSLSHLRAAPGRRCQKWKEDGNSYRGIICEFHIVVFVKSGLKMALLPWSHPHATLGHRCLKWKKDGSSSWSHPRVVHCHLC